MGGVRNEGVCHAEVGGFGVEVPAAPSLGHGTLFGGEVGAGREDGHALAVGVDRAHEQTGHVMG